MSFKIIFDLVGFVAPHSGGKYPHRCVRFISSNTHSFLWAACLDCFYSQTSPGKIHTRQGTCARRVCCDASSESLLWTSFLLFFSYQGKPTTWCSWQADLHVYSRRDRFCLAQDFTHHIKEVWIARETSNPPCLDLARGNDHAGPTAVHDWGRNKAEESNTFVLTSPPQSQSSLQLQTKSAHNPRTFNPHLDPE